MIRIKTSDNFLSEKEYVFDVLLKDRLGLEYSLEIDSAAQAYEVCCNDRSLNFPDLFFSKSPRDYFSGDDYRPKVCSWSDFGIFSESVPVFYGEASLTHLNGSSSLGFDLVACVFFCLSRWEELGDEERDHYDRYTDDASFLKQQGIEAYPIVDYCESILADFLGKCGEEIKPRKSTVELTHDIDLISYFGSAFRSIKAAAGDLIKRRSLRYFSWTVRNLISGAKDPYNTVDELLALNKNKWPQIFYFIALKDKVHGADYSLEDEKWRELLKRILKSGAEIGLHPSLYSYLDEEKTLAEKKRLKKYSKRTISRSRQHFLQFKWPETARILEKCRIQEDSTVHFRSAYGFKSGTSIPYRMYDPVERRKMDLTENPLVFMDWNLQLSGKSPSRGMEDLVSIAKRINEVKGRFTILWHNSSYNHPEWEAYEGFIEELVDEIDLIFLAE